MRHFKRGHLPAKAPAERFEGFRKLIRGKRDTLSVDPAPSDRQTLREGSSTETIPPDPSPSDPTPWDRAYDRLRVDDPHLVKDYEALLAKEAHDTPISSERKSRQTQLSSIISAGLSRVEAEKTTYTIAGHTFVLRDQISQAANLTLWAKDWIGNAVRSSPEASLAWAGICIILPLLTNPKTAGEANRDGFTLVTARMRYYTALEPMLRRLGQNEGVDADLVKDADESLVALYRQILEFQVRSVLRFYQNGLAKFMRDVSQPEVWNEMGDKIKALDEAFSDRLRQINALASRQELESLNATSMNALQTLLQFLSLGQRQILVAEEQREIAKDELQIQQEILKKKLEEREKACIQLFRLTTGSNDATYEWYKDRVEDRVEGTCHWFVDHPHYQRWLEQDSSLLVVSADPGCGKSVLAKYLIDKQLPRSATICYFFFKDQDQNTLNQALCAVIHQLLSSFSFLVDQHLLSEFDKNGAGLIHITGKLWDILIKATQQPKISNRIIIVLDALDECAEADFEYLVRKLREHYTSFSQTGGVKFLLTSRPYDRIVSPFQGLISSFPYIRIPGEEESEAISREVNYVIQHRVERLATSKRLSQDVRDHLQRHLMSVSHRTYLWVYLVFDYLQSEDFKRTKKGIDAMISSLPDNVNQAYEKILSKSKSDRMVHKVLSIVLAANRPLTLGEMNLAVNTELTSRSLDDLDLEDEEDFRNRLRSWCGLFVAIHHGNIYFLHQTAREFLLGDLVEPSLDATKLRWHHSITSRQAHVVLAEACIGHLGMFNYVTYPSESDNSDDEKPNINVLRKQCPTFTEYCAMHWANHTREADIGDHASILSSIVAICEPGSNAHREWSRSTYWRDLPTNMSPIGTAAFFGLDSVLALLLGEGVDFEAKNGYNQTPLLCAARNGHNSMVRLLLDKGADIEGLGGDSDSRTPLLWAVQNGHLEVAKLLLERGANTEAIDKSRQSALSCAAAHQDTTLAKLLLDMGADIETRDRVGMTPLSISAEQGDIEMMRLLIGRGANMESRDESGKTAIFHAACHGHEAAAKLLLTKGAEVECKDDWGQTPLSRCAESAILERMVELLLDHGANMEAEDTWGRRPLHWAADKGREHVVKILLDRGANIDPMDKWRLTPLRQAAKNGHQYVVEMLTSRDAALDNGTIP